VQDLNGVDMGSIVHSANAYINIANHIGNEIKNILVTKIINSKSKISLIIDESTTVSQKSTLTLPKNLMVQLPYVQYIELK
jgi:hypothetical protein